MIEDIPTPNKAPETRQRIRPQLNWRPVLLVIGLVLFFAIGLGVGFFMWGKPLTAARIELADVKSQLETLQAAAEAAEGQASQANTNETDTATADGEIKQVKRYPVPEDGDPAYGPADAPITIIEFSDFQCPYCQKWHTEVLKPLLQMYPDKIRFVYRDFPLFSIHPEALPAAIAANCAGEQGKYYEYHNKLFEASSGLSLAAYIQYA